MLIRIAFSLVVVAILVSIAPGVALGQSAWEYFGPDIGYRTDSFFVSVNAIYAGLSEENWFGLGLYRYLFYEAQWEPLAWEGYSILGVTVWGESDENILLIRYDRVHHDSDILRSTDGGETWTVTHERDYAIWGLSQAPSDTSRVLTHYGVRYSTDAGWTWTLASGAPWNGTDGLAIDPTSSLVAYLTGQSETGHVHIYKSTNGGANWNLVCGGCGGSGIEVERAQPNHVMGGNQYHWVRLSTDAGETWFVRDTPFFTKEPHCPPWSPGSFYVAGSDSAQSFYEVWHTEDFGQTWFECGDGLPELPDNLSRTLIHLECHPTEPVLYAALEGSGVWRWDATISGTPNEGDGLTLETRLFVHPVPSVNTFTYGIRLSKPGHVVLRLYDTRGRLIAPLRDGLFSAGTHRFTWDDADNRDRHTTSGVYYLRLDTWERQEAKKVILLR